MAFAANLAHVTQVYFLRRFTTEQASSADGRHGITALVTKARLMTGLCALTPRLRMRRTHRLCLCLFDLVLGVLLALRAERVSNLW